MCPLCKRKFRTILKFNYIEKETKYYFQKKNEYGCNAHINGTLIYEFLRFYNKKYVVLDHVQTQGLIDRSIGTEGVLLPETLNYINLYVYC